MTTSLAKQRLEDSRMIQSTHAFIDSPRTTVLSPPTDPIVQVPLTRKNVNLYRSSHTTPEKPQSPRDRLTEEREARPEDEINSEIRHQRVSMWQEAPAAQPPSDRSFPLDHFYGPGERRTSGEVLHMLRDCQTSPIPWEEKEEGQFSEGEEPTVTEEDSWIKRWRKVNKNVNSVPFRKQFKESEKRFREQIEVHREISEAMSKIKLVEHQTKVLKAERRTTALVTSLISRQNAALLKAFPTDSPFWKQMEEEEERLSKIALVTPPYYLEKRRVPPPAELQSVPAVQSVPTATATETQKDVPAAPNPMLEILAQFSKPKPTGSDTSTKGDKKSKSKEPAKPSKTLASIQVTPLEQEPVPYPRIRYVLRPPKEPSVSPSSTKKSYEDDFEDHLEERIEEEYSSDSDAIIEEENSIAEDISDYSENTFEDSISEEVLDSVESGSGSTTSDGIEDDVIESDSVADGGGGGGRRSTGVRTVELKKILEQFYTACRTANQLGGLLTGKVNGGWLEKEAKKRRDSSADGSASTVASSASGDTTSWQTTLRKDFADLKRLRRFNQKVQKNIKAVDLQRKIRAQKEKLVEKAVKLSKVKKRQNRSPKSRLRDFIEDDVESVLASLDSSMQRRRKRGKRTNEDEIEDEIESDYDLGSAENSDEDDIIDDMMEDFEDFQGSDSMGDEIEDDIADEWGSSGHSSSGEDAIDDIALDFSEEVESAVGSDVILNEVEEDFVERLGSVSSSEIEQIVSEGDFDDLPSDVSDPIEENVVAANDSLPSSVAEISDEAPIEEMGERVEKDREVDSGVVLDSVGGSSLPSLTHSSDADRSSFYPSSSTTSFMNSSDLSYEEAVAGEVALQDLEANMKETEYRRKKALTILDPSQRDTLSALIDPNESSDNSEEEEEEESTASEETGGEGKLSKDSQASAADPLPPPLTAFEVSEEAVLPFLHREESHPPVDDSTAHPTASPPERKKPNYPADDLIALQEWKERQKALFRQILPSVDPGPEAVGPHPSVDKEKEGEEEEEEGEVKSFAHHWGVLEALLETRCGKQRSKSPQEDLPIRRPRRKVISEPPSSSASEAGYNS